VIAVVLATLFLSVILCGAYLRLALRWRLLDAPNERSSHRAPTPHGGGVPLILALAAGLACAAWSGVAWSWQLLFLAGVACLLMLLGVIDDMRDLSSKLRFALYGLCCLGTAVLLLAPLQGGWPLAMRLLVLLPVSLGMLWLLNLYNFMDGIDGIAALQCVLVCFSVAGLCWSDPRASHYVLFCLLLGVSHLGFLVWNWPPARLFMGDAGSVPTGYLLAALALLGSVQGVLNPACWLILLALFITDASWTLVWRAATAQAFTRPHRLHAYQRLSRHWRSHRKVDYLLAGITAVWLLPLAWAARLRPEWSVLLVILAYLPLLWGMAKAYKVE
jgi:Fuc2NAc and GlcNAc transferase